MDNKHFFLFPCFNFKIKYFFRFDVIVIIFFRVLADIAHGKDILTMSGVKTMYIVLPCYIHFCNVTFFAKHCVYGKIKPCNVKQVKVI